MKCNWWLYIGIVLVSACSQLHVEEEALPDVFDLTPASIKTDLPVINIEADQTEFNRMMTSYYSKVFVSGALETQGYLSIKDSTSISMEMEIRGRSSVGADFPLKSLGIILTEPIEASNYWGNSGVPTLKGHQISAFSGFRLRSSGNDFGHTQLKDLAYTRFAVACGLNVELMYGAPAQVFINNKYYGLMNLRTESNSRGIAELLQEDSSEITIIKVKDNSENFKVDEGEPLNAELLLNAIDADDYSGIVNQIDEANFIDYILVQDYFGNGDWANNIKAYKVKGAAFRFILFDLDLAGNVGGIKLVSKLEFLSADIAKVYRAFQAQPGFNNRLANRQKELYQRFSSHLFNAIVDDLTAEIANDIPYLIAQYGQPKSVLHWQMEVAHLKLDFEGRDAAIRNQYNL